MSEPVSLAEAKLFLRIEHGAEDELILMLLEAAKEKAEAATGLSLDAEAPAMVRLAMLKLVHDAYERGGPVEAGSVEAWLAPFRTVRL
ncbi:head-tail connector protein [Brevundimonas sp.]|uniref:head-tail connector protein n=1 Tax=Brevundimonas sp. TaxID=1871086 RepID=UPI0025EDCD0A|nr:head-tail connector protein [Brevundimonas sp.]